MPLTVPRVWKPASTCFACDHINDFDASFCQARGTPQSITELPSTPGTYDFDGIETRRASFRRAFDQKPYERQKSSLETRFATLQLSRFGFKTDRIG